MRRAERDETSFAVPVMRLADVDLLAHIVGHAVKSRLHPDDDFVFGDVAWLLRKLPIDPEACAAHMESLQMRRAAGYVFGAAASKGEAVAREIVRDDIYQLRAVLSRWIADPGVEVILSTGGTGITGRDSTPEAVVPLLDKVIEGFGELFRQISFEEIGASTIQSRCVAGLANGTFIFCLPGSSGACRTGWEKILAPQLDRRTRPCNFAILIPRLRER